MGFDHYSENKLKTCMIKFLLLDNLCCFGVLHFFMWLFLHRLYHLIVAFPEPFVHLFRYLIIIYWQIDSLN